MRREVIAVLKVSAHKQSPKTAMEAVRGAPGAVARTLERYGATMRPVFEAAPVPPSESRRLTGALAKSPANEIARYRTIEVADKKADALVKALKSLDEIEAVYIKPAVENPLAPRDPRARRLAAAAPTPLPQPGTIPNFNTLQTYLDPAPGGIDARYAWTLSGGLGSGVNIIDIEGGWQLTHLDLRANSGGLLGGAAINDVAWRNHGTAVLGILGGDANGFGVTGIAAAARLSTMSHGGLGSAGAIQHATTRLKAGDILVLEMHRPGPRFNFQSRADQKGFIAVEWWPDDYLAILNATSKGILVVEAAGNGWENLDDALYDTPAAGFPTSWRNPFRRGNRDSRAVLVGAGAPPSGHYGPDRSRLNFSNFGNCVDCQGWGREVASCGYGDLYQGATEDSWYTRSFAGTSSATPIVAGAVACLQGIATQRGVSVTPDRLRTALRTGGSPQAAGLSGPASQRIGPRPNLRTLIPALLGPAATSGPTLAARGRKSSKPRRRRSSRAAKR